jgi:hypothetical protein
VVCFTSKRFYPKAKSSLMSIRHEVGWAPEPVWTLDEIKISCSFLELNPISQFPARYMFTILTDVRAPRIRTLNDFKFPIDA